MSDIASAAPKNTSPGDEPSPGDAKKKRRRIQLWLALVPVCAALLLVLAFALDTSLSKNKVLRGVQVLDVPLAGLDRESAERALSDLNEKLRARALSVHVGAEVFDISPEQIGASIDIPKTAGLALSAGREGGIAKTFGCWFSRLRSPVSIEPALAPLAPSVQVLFDEWEKKAVPDPPFEGAIVIQENAPIADYPRAGHGIDREASLSLIQHSFASSPNAAPPNLNLPLKDVQPVRSRAELDSALELAKKLLSAPVVLKPDPAMLPAAEAEKEGERASGEEAAPKKKSKKKERGKDESESEQPRPAPSLRMEVADLARALQMRLTQGDVVYDLYFHPEIVEEKLQPLRPLLERPPRDARFSVDEKDAVHIEPGQPGTHISSERIARLLLEAALREPREGLLLIEEGDPPELSLEAAQALHIDGLVSKATTRHPCCQARVKNIHRIADLVNGRVVRPGETFSLNEAVGERTAKNGFVPAPGIEDGEMVDTMGGGVSQFATTFFNAMFHGGYEIIERQPHSFYFSRYPMGHEATLSWPKPDLIIRNDTQAGILIQTVYDKTSITVKLYGNNGGRKVKAKVSRKYDIVKPKVEYLPNPKLSPSKSKVKESGSVGWSVTVSRIVEFADGTSKEESRKVTYKPRPRRVFVHPCRIPEGEPGHTSEKCPEPEEGESESSAPAGPPVLSEDAPAPF